MMAILALACTVACYSVQNIFVKDYQKRCGVGLSQSMWFTLMKSLFTIGLFFVLNGFRLTVTGPTTLFAALFALAAIFANWGAISAYGMGKIATVNMYVLIGSALVPFLYGILFLGEPMTLTKGVAVVLMCLSFVPAALFSGEKRQSGERGRFFFLCFICFLSNGAAGLLLKLNQAAENTAPANDFLIMMSIILAVLCVMILPFSRPRGTAGTGERPPLVSRESRNLRSAGCALGLCVFNGTASVMSMFAAESLPSSIQFPIISGGQLLLVSLLGWIFFRERITRADAIGMALALAAMVLFIL